MMRPVCCIQSRPGLLQWCQARNSTQWFQWEDWSGEMQSKNNLPSESCRCFYVPKLCMKTEGSQRNPKDSTTQAKGVQLGFLVQFGYACIPRAVRSYEASCVLKWESSAQGDGTQVEEINTGHERWLATNGFTFGVTPPGKWAPASQRIPFTWGDWYQEPIFSMPFSLSEIEASLRHVGRPVLFIKMASATCLTSANTMTLFQRDVQQQCLSYVEAS